MDNTSALFGLHKDTNEGAAREQAAPPNVGYGSPTGRAHWFVTGISLQRQTVLKGCLFVSLQ